MASKLSQTARDILDHLKRASDDIGVSVPSNINKNSALFREIKDGTVKVDDRFKAPKKKIDGADRKKVEADSNYKPTDAEKAEKKRVRDKSPNSDAKKHTEKEGNTDDYYPDNPDVQNTPGYGDKMHADHAFAYDNMWDLPGFRDLPEAQKVEVANTLHNFVGIDGGVNSSMGNKGPDWPGHSKYGPLSPEGRARLETNHWLGELAVKLHILRLLEQNG
ncbi:hypothetical protein [Agrococcus casei]|uniref:Uncharacterized protein n=1 Tax=Agrococcus casei LMG 22410 TaxID=1255656 RepID=A0A1R4GC53_9MICO|nr:hypothetical protein [Agrococcus casei]SJM65756.1 hypothetical protein CZ674_10730 [Agrococcus casei LMG 22410]